MSQSATTSGIVTSVSFLTFAKQFARCQVAEFTNKESGEHFSKVVFTPKNFGEEGVERTFVSFSSNLGELSPAEIAAMKSDLSVVTMDSGKHVLCKAANAWQDVDLGL